MTLSPPGFDLARGVDFILTNGPLAPTMMIAEKGAAMVNEDRRAGVLKAAS